MLNPLIAKLEHGVDLTHEDRGLLIELTRHTRRVEARRDIIHEGDRPEVVYLVLEGVACRYKVLNNGGRQIMALLVPGDFCDLHVAILDVMDHGIATLSACTMVEIPRTAIVDLTERQPRIPHALWWCTLVDEGTLREWLVNLGQRDADHRMAHLFCELLVRLQAVGLGDENSYDLPINQIELGEALGISAVHTNRTLQTLREAGYIILKDKHVVIPDVARLNTYCGFNPNYLHLTKRQTKDPRARAL